MLPKLLSSWMSLRPLLAPALYDPDDPSSVESMSQSSSSEDSSISASMFFIKMSYCVWEIFPNFSSMAFCLAAMAAGVNESSTNTILWQPPE